MKLTFTLIALFSCCLLNAQKAGTPDSSFGVDGIFFNQDNADYTGVVLQHTGKTILFGGKVFNDTLSFFLSRHNTDGSLDTSFGRNGYSINNYNIFYNAEFYSLNVLSDDKIIAAGFALSDEDRTDAIIAKFNPDGSPDPTFGNNGYAKYYFDYFQYLNSIAVQTDNKIVVAGAHTPDIYEDTGFVVRFLSNGNLDSTFGDDGQVRLKEASWLSSVIIQGDGKIVVGGTSNDFSPEFFVGRLNANGSYDTTFGENGYVYTRFTNHLHDGVSSMELQPDGKIVAAGPVNENNTGTKENMGVARYNTDATLDQSFGVYGLSTIKFNTLSAVNNILLQRDGRFVLTGFSFSPFFGFDTLVIAKLKSNGTPDSSFGSDGKVVSGLIVDGSWGSALQKDGKIILAANNDSTDFIARYNNDDLSKKQIIVQKIKHYIQTHNAQATTLNNVFIYPNPAQNVLHVEGLSANAKLTVVDLNGRIAASYELRAASGLYDLNIASLHAGNYLLKIEANGEVVTKQFIKQ